MEVTVLLERYKSIDFDRLASDSQFREDSVRELVILPLIQWLGYQGDQVERSPQLQHPYLTVGSSSQARLLIPDYVLRSEGRCLCVIEAKAPKVFVDDPAAVDQAFSYASHREVRAPYFIVCNGVSLALYRTDSRFSPLLRFDMREIGLNAGHLARFIACDPGVRESVPLEVIQEKFNYMDIGLLDPMLPVNKQGARRHYGVHGYFTRQAWNVVQKYIDHYSRPGDLVLDPFGGSGVTAIEAMMLGRRAIHLDLNPLSEFMVRALTVPVDLAALDKAYWRVCKGYQNQAPKNEGDVERILTECPQPQDLPLPRGSDVPSVWGLFTQEHQAQLSLLRFLIQKERNPAIRDTLMLMFSGLVSRYNLTYHTSSTRPSSGAGNCSPFQYYRYRLAPKPVKGDLMDIFALRNKKIVAAKLEIADRINTDTYGNLKIIQGSATELRAAGIEKSSVDFIYTDPPYGDKIPYLDLSQMWNAWLGLEVPQAAWDKEVIEGGSLEKGRDQYDAMLEKSIQDMFHVLKPDRWLAFVFAHKDPSYWHRIRNVAEYSGFEYVSAVPQSNGQSSFKKRQNAQSVLSGQLILMFRKRTTPRMIVRERYGVPSGANLDQVIEETIVRNAGATIEQINDAIIVPAMYHGYLHLLQYSDVTDLLTTEYEFDKASKKYYLRSDHVSHIPMPAEHRLEYYVLSYMQRSDAEGVFPDLNDVVLYVMPLLHNGDTPTEQSIQQALERIAEPDLTGHWRLKPREEWTRITDRDKAAKEQDSGKEGE